MTNQYTDSPVDFAKVLLVALCFEQYLRFFFLDIPDDAELDAPATLHVPDEVVNEIKQDSPRFVPLLNALQDRQITFDESRAAVIAQAAHLMDFESNASEYKNMVAEVSATEFFQDELLEFHSWVQEMDETQDATELLPFNDWLERYRFWRENPTR